MTYQRRRCFLSSAPLLMSLISGIWLLSSRFAASYFVDLLSEPSYFAFLWFALPVFIWSVFFSLVHMLRARPTARRGVAASPLVLNLLVAVLFVLPTPVIEQMDFQRHEAVRADVVRRIESGELRTRGPLPGELADGSPGASLLFLPQSGYLPSVSGGNDRLVIVYLEKGILNVVFRPMTGGILSEHPAILYRADGQSPSLTSPFLGAVSSEPLGDNWHLVHFARGDAANLTIMLAVLVLSAAIGVVAIPIAIGVQRLERQALGPSEPVRG